jgi:hypothetical protein
VETGFRYIEITLQVADKWQVRIANAAQNSSGEKR